MSFPRGNRESLGSCGASWVQLHKGRSVKLAEACVWKDENGSRDGSQPTLPDSEHFFTERVYVGQLRWDRQPLT